MVFIYKFCKKLIQPPGGPREHHLGEVHVLVLLIELYFFHYFSIYDVINVFNRRPPDITLITWHKKWWTCSICTLALLLYQMEPKVIGTNTLLIFLYCFISRYSQLHCMSTYFYYFWLLFSGVGFFFNVVGILLFVGESDKVKGRHTIVFSGRTTLLRPRYPLELSGSYFVHIFL